jgi:AmmeMemoRadiSam system protein A
MTAAVTPAGGALLARLAAYVIGAELAGQVVSIAVPDDAALQTDGASFVTLERQGALRGCVGTLESSRPLYEDVMRNALRAMSDPRLPPIAPTEWADLDVKVSVLSGMEPVDAETLDALLCALRPGVDGLLLTDGHRRATFLPAVWQKLREPRAFVAALLAKGGWAAGQWPVDLQACRYTSMEFRDPAPRAALVQTFPPEAS